MFRSLALFIIGLSSFAAAATNDVPYTLKDLQQLASVGANSELYQHLQDIPPSQRDKAWQNLVNTSALKLLEDSLRIGDYSRAMMQAADSLEQFPLLSRNADYIASAMNGIEVATTQCDGTCISMIMPALQHHPEQNRLAFVIAKRLARNQHNNEKDPAMLDLLVMATNDSRYCNDEFTQAYLSAGINSELNHYQQLSSQIITQQCKGQKFENIDTLLRSDEKARRLLCEPMLKNKQLNTLSKEICEIQLSASL